MNSSKLMRERIRRVEVLLKELGFDSEPEELAEDGYGAAVFEGENYVFGITVDRESKFLEIGYSFAFSKSLQERIRRSMEEIMSICYEYGSYTTLAIVEEEIVLSLFSKIYFAGLNYYALKETVRDLRSAISLVTDLLDFEAQLTGKESYGDP